MLRSTAKNRIAVMISALFTLGPTPHPHEICRENLICNVCYITIYKASFNDILVSGQDFPSQPSGRAVIIIHYVISYYDERILRHSSTIF